MKWRLLNASHRTRKITYGSPWKFKLCALFWIFERQAFWRWCKMLRNPSKASIAHFPNLIISSQEWSRTRRKSTCGPLASGIPAEVASLRATSDTWSDTWHLQVVLFVMLAGVPPFHDDDDLELMKKVKKGFGAQLKRTHNNIHQEQGGVAGWWLPLPKRQTGQFVNFHGSFDYKTNIPPKRTT